MSAAEPPASDPANATLGPRCRVTSEMRGETIHDHETDAEGHRDARGDDPAGEAFAAEIARRVDAEPATGRHDRPFGRG